MRTLLSLLAFVSFASAAEPVQLTLADFTSLKGEAPPVAGSAEVRKHDPSGRQVAAAI